MLFSLVYGLSIAAACWLGLFLTFDLIKDQIDKILSAYFWGASTASFITGLLASLTRRMKRSFRALIILLTLIAFTICDTALLFALEYREFYAQWHAPVLTKTWFFEQAFTTLGAFYQFAVLGLRLYLPLGPFIVLLASIILSRRVS